MHGYEPFMYNPRYNRDTEDELPVEFYGARFCSDEILRAHHEYGEMAYNTGSNCCNCHGI